MRLARVTGRSMEPTLRAGDLLLVASPGRAAPGRVAIVALPGEAVRAVKRLTFRQDAGWWVERDNPAEGVDSWQVGALPDDAVLGVVVARIWPSPKRL